MILQVPCNSQKLMYCTWVILEIIGPPVSHQEYNCLYISWFMSFSGSLKVTTHNFHLTSISDFKLLSYVIISFFSVETNKKTKNNYSLSHVFFSVEFFPKVHRKGRSPTVHHRRAIAPGLLRGELMEKRGVRKCLVRMAPYCRAQRSEVWGWAGCRSVQTWLIQWKMMIITILGGGNSNIFVIFTLIPGEVIQFDERIVQMG